MKTVAQRKTAPSLMEKKRKMEVELQHQNPFLEADSTHQNPFKIHSDLQSNPFAKGQAQSNNPFSVDTVQKKEDNSSSQGGLPPQVQSQMEQSFGADFSDVKIQKNSSQAKQMGALAFTQGNQVHFAQGKFEPESKKGQELIGHELAHVVQQRSGKVKPELNLGGTPVNADQHLEAEADRQGAKAANAVPVAQNKITQSGSPSTQTSQAPVQGFFGNLVKKGLGMLKSKVVEMIPQEYKNMIPPQLREMADNITNQGIEAAGNFAEEKGGQLMEKAKSKLATVVPPQLVELVNKIPPELRTYLEGLLERGGQLAKGALEEGRLPTGEELKAFGKDAGVGAVDLGKQMIPKVVPPEMQEMFNKLPPEIKDYAKDQFEKGTDALKEGIQSGEMPDGKAFLDQAIEGAKDTGIELGKRKIQEIVPKLSGKINDLINDLPPELKDLIMQLLPSDKKEVKEIDETPSAPDPTVPELTPEDKPNDEVKKPDIKKPDNEVKPDLPVKKPTGGNGGKPMEDKKPTQETSPKGKRNRAAEAEAKHIARIRGANAKKGAGGGAAPKKAAPKKTGGTPNYMKPTASSLAKKRKKA